METFRQFVVTGKGLWYTSYARCFGYKRISPRSYRAGEQVGYTIGFVSGVLLCVLIACFVVGCVAPEKVDVAAKVVAEVEAALIRMGDKTLSGRDTVIGGGGDSITTWILALGIVSVIPLSALFYTKVVRALRMRGEKKKKQCGDTRVGVDSLDV